MRALKPAQIPLLELDLLRTLVTIVDAGTFSSAAEQLFRTPSAVSMQVKRIEEIVGQPLFNRDSRSVSATPAGELLLEHGRRLLSMNQEMVGRFIEPEVAGLVRLGAPDEWAERSLPQVLRSFSQQHCCVTVDVVIDSSVELHRRVKDGELDLALLTLNPFEKSAKGVKEVYRERLVWAGAKNGVAYKTKPLPISVWEEDCAWRKVAIKSLKKNKCAYRVAFMSSHISAQKAAILADLVVAPIPVSSCENGIIELGEKHGLPPLTDYTLGIIVGDKPAVPVVAAAEHLQAHFEDL